MAEPAYDRRVEPAFEGAPPTPAESFIPPLPRISIQAFCETSPTYQTLQDASADRRASRAQMTVQMGGIAAAIEFYESAPTPNVIVLESSGGNNLLEMLDRLAMSCDPGTRVLVVGHVNDVVLYRKLIERGISDYLIAPIDARAALSSLSSLFSSEDAGSLGRTVAFVGAKGGVGASTICHNVAWAIAQELLKNVVIVDLDLPFGTAGLDFNQDPVQGLSDAIYGADRLDENYVDRLCSKLNDRLSLMAAPATLDKDYDLGDDAFEPVISLIRKQVPCVILDVPHVWTGWARQTLVGADDVVIVAAPDLANLRNAKNIVDLLKQGRPNDRDPLLVLNMVGIAKRPEIQPRDFASALGLQPTATIMFDPQLFGTASNNGQMIAEAQPNAKIGEVFHEIAETLFGRPDIKRTKKSPLQPLLDKFKRKKA